MSTLEHARPPTGPAGRVLRGPIPVFAAVFLGVEGLLRTALVLRDGAQMDLDARHLAAILGLGLLRDLVAFAWIALPVALYLVVAPRRLLRSRAHRALVHAALVLWAFVVLMGAACEWLFWAEFETRLNFIAVDYLVYTTEVVDNILESYPVAAIVAVQLALALAVGVALRRRLARELERERGRAAALASLAGLLLLAGFDLSPLAPRAGVVGANRYAQQAALNGAATLVDAFRNPILDYDRFYRTLPSAVAFERVRAATRAENARFVSPRVDDFTRVVRNGGAGRQLNVVMIVVESLSADFLGCYGSERGLTPELDAIAERSLLFENVFATGCRTVRGLEALSLMVPPTPGRSILHRRNNQHLTASGQIFRDKGYEALFLYGGYGYFDEMNGFFSGNGFSVVDRSDFEPDEVRFSNAWGVCDEDLLARTLRECDATERAGKPFFAMVMTTSNHRPYTYPDVVGLPPSGSGRDGAVRYTDHAIGGFLEAARSRPWFERTLFVIVADHCASSAGRAELELSKHHIPLLIHAPGIVGSGRVARLGSQIDVVPTVLDLLDADYTTRGYGNSLLAPGEGRALVGNYQNVALFRDGRLTVLLPRKRVVCYATGPHLELEPCTPDEGLVAETIAYYQTAAELYADGGLAWVDPH